MSKIVVHRVLLYSIVQHKVWFLFRIIKWKMLTSCALLLYKNLFLETCRLAFLPLQERRGKHVSHSEYPAPVPSSAGLMERVQGPLPRCLLRQRGQQQETGLWCFCRAVSTAGWEQSPRQKPFRKFSGFVFLDKPFLCHQRCVSVRPAPSQPPGSWLANPAGIFKSRFSSSPAARLGQFTLRGGGSFKGRDRDLAKALAGFRPTFPQTLAHSSPHGSGPKPGYLGLFQAALALRSMNKVADTLGEFKKNFNRSNTKFYMFK